MQQLGAHHGDHLFPQGGHPLALLLHRGGVTLAAHRLHHHFQLQTVQLLGDALHADGGGAVEAVPVKAQPGAVDALRHLVTAQRVQPQAAVAAQGIAVFPGAGAQGHVARHLLAATGADAEAVGRHGHVDQRQHLAEHGLKADFRVQLGQHQGALRAGHAQVAAAHKEVADLGDRVVDPTVHAQLRQRGTQLRALEPERRHQHTQVHAAVEGIPAVPDHRRLAGEQAVDHLLDFRRQRAQVQLAARVGEPQGRTVGAEQQRPVVNLAAITKLAGVGLQHGHIRRQPIKHQTNTRVGAEQPLVVLGDIQPHQVGARYDFLARHLGAHRVFHLIADHIAGGQPEPAQHQDREKQFFHFSPNG